MEAGPQVTSPQSLLLPPAIEICDLHKTYNGIPAVNGLSITVAQGSFFGFLGPNGAGKTTTIKILMGLTQPTFGTVKILGMTIQDHALEIKQQIGLVPDDTLLFDYLTGPEYLQFVGRMYALSRSVAEDRSQELLALFELDESPRKLVGEYSKGMRKRLAMAAALIHRPKLFLMDEPFEGVDAVGARLMKDLLLDQVLRGATVFLTSHVLEVVERLCDTIAILNRGKVEVSGSVRDLQQQSGAGVSTLEEVFVRHVGASHHTEKLDWL